VGAGDRSIRFVCASWALLFFNVLGTDGGAGGLIPHRFQQVLTQGSLFLAFGLAIMVNHKIRLRPNLFLSLYTLLAILTAMTSVRFVSLGTDYRLGRLLLFLATLWILTPWWGRRDAPLLRTQLGFLIGIVVSVVVGFFVHHGAAMDGGRLQGVLWPIPPPQVAHYTSEIIGIAVLMWVCRLITPKRALMIVVPSVAVLLLTHTRTALVGLLVGLLVAGLSLFTASRRVRHIFAAVCAVIVFLVLPLSPILTSWLARGENTQELSTLTGRTKAWTAVLSEPRPLTNELLGSGLTNKSVVGAAPEFVGMDGLAIDSGWISTFQDQGIIGDVLEGVIFLALLLIAMSRPRGPSRALALFLIVYCFVASFTESGMGDASTYLMDLTLAASLLALPVTNVVGGRAGDRVPALNDR
jgi:hypothetical protein